EESLEGGFGYARSAVGHGHDSLCWVTLDGDPDLRAGGRMAHRVLDEIRQHLIDLDVVERYRRHLIGNTNVHGVVACHCAQAPEDIIDERSQVVPAALGAQRARLHPGEV